MTDVIMYECKMLPPPQSTTKAFVKPPNMRKEEKTEEESESIIAKNAMPFLLGLAVGFLVKRK
tara:strand:+ start:212 stop:400 length:189 start_codon:yes stop_codon:yes gene_type:complete